MISRGDGRVEVSLESPASAGLFRFWGHSAATDPKRSQVVDADGNLLFRPYQSGADQTQMQESSRVSARDLCRILRGQEPCPVFWTLIQETSMADHPSNHFAKILSADLMAVGGTRATGTQGSFAPRAETYSAELTVKYGLPELGLMYAAVPCDACRTSPICRH